MFPIKLSNSDKLAFVDSCDALAVSQYTWRLDKNGYVRADVHHKGSRKTLYLQRFVMLRHRKDKRVADHINQDKLDCRRSNLRLISQADNGYANIQRFPDNYPAQDPKQTVLSTVALPKPGQDSFSDVTYDESFRQFWKQVERWHEVRDD